jgi:hypothetical protein
MVPLKFLLVGSALALTSACAARPPADPAEVRGLTRAFEPECVREMKADDESRRLMTQIDMTAHDFCECMGERFFGSFTQSDLKRFMRDSARYADIAEHEPWETRANSAALRCLGDEMLSGERASSRWLDEPSESVGG